MKKINNFRKLVLTTIILLMLSNIPGLTFGINGLTETQIMTLSLQDEVWVNDDYPWEDSTHFRTIQGGVDHVYSSGTVHVCSGLYNESIIIKKSVRIIGCPEDEYGTDSYPPHVRDPTVAFIIIGNNAQGTTISHFNITGGLVAGIMVLNSIFVNISSNNIILNRRGIYLLSSSFCNITCNNVFSNTYMGISLENANHCNISGNWVVDNDANGLDDVDGSGIDLSYSNYALILYNHIASNGNYTIWIGWSKGLNKIYSNNIIDNKTTFKRNVHRRWIDSNNDWNNNHWSDATLRWYCVRGWYPVVFGPLNIPLSQIDSAAEREFSYQPNEI